MIILGIETSCDETAAAVCTRERKIASSVIFSQIDLHKQFGGVVPEIASRSHLEKIHLVVQQALDEAQLSLSTIDAIAVTSKPGLPGSLLVGLNFAKAIAYGAEKKIIGVDHLEGHVFSSMIENQVPFPHICLTASGGHTALYLVKDFGDFEPLGTTRDDAAGEAFDKVAKLMNLPYPGGPVIEKLAQKVNFQDFFKYPRLKDTHGLDFSFSGLKTAVLYDLVDRDAYDLEKKQFLAENNLELKEHVASSLLCAIGDIFSQRIANAIERYPNVKAVTFVGGVACNEYLRQKLQAVAQKNAWSFFYPSPKYCTDNAAMIAFVGNYKAQQEKFDGLTLDIF